MSWPWWRLFNQRRPAETLEIRKLLKLGLCNNGYIGMDSETKSHVERVKAWLEDNVQTFPEPAFVKLDDFTVDWEEFSGEFRVAFDSVVLSKKLRFGLDASGKTAFYVPMFHSPLGAPASYAAIDITEKTHKAILSGLHASIPRITGAGLDSETGESISYHTPPKERIDPEELSTARDTITSDYSIVVELQNV